MMDEHYEYIPHISYAVSYKELISMWVDLYHQDDHVVIIYDPVNHMDYLKLLNIELDEINLYESKILTVHMIDVDDALDLCKSLSHTEGPFAQVWSLGDFITDNIEK
jgi:hypothetical protein